MKNSLILLAISTVALSACGPTPPNDEERVSQYLTKNGLHVVDVGDLGVPSSNTYVPPINLCLSAPKAFSFRAIQQDGHTMVGVACLEQDDSVIISLSKVLG